MKIAGGVSVKWVAQYLLPAALLAALLVLAACSDSHGPLEQPLPDAAPSKWTAAWSTSRSGGTALTPAANSVSPHTAVATICTPTAMVTKRWLIA